MNDIIVKFYEFEETNAIDNHIVITSFIYMLIKLLHITFINISLSELSINVIFLEIVKFIYQKSHDKLIMMKQFSVILVYMIIDYKCQNKTFYLLIVYLSKLIDTDSVLASFTSIYVQLFCCTSFNRI